MKLKDTGQLASSDNCKLPTYSMPRNKRRRSASRERNSYPWCGALHFTPTPRWTHWSGCLARLPTALPLGAAPPHHQALVLQTLALGGSHTP